MLHTVNIGEMKFTSGTSDKLVTHALASCVAVTVYCKRQKCAGMIHIALPNKGNYRSNNRDTYYADTGLPIFLEKFSNRCKCSQNDLEVKIYGGAKSINPEDLFNIGDKNILSVVSILDAYSLKYKFAGVGGFVSRTIELNVDDGFVKLSELPIII